MENKVLSIAIAAYNVEQYLEDAVESVLMTDAADNIEVIIVNDGSKDGTLAVANKLKQRHPSSVVVIDKENGGYGSTINRSLEIAKGKYYKLLDGDDWYYSESLNKYIDFLNRSEADLIISPYYLVRGEKELADYHQELGEETKALAECPLNNYNFHMTEMAIKTSALKAFDHKITERSFYTDVEFVFYSIISINTVSRYNEPVYCYRLGVEGQSVSLEGFKKHYKDQRKVLRAICNCYLEQSNEISGNKREILDIAIANSIRSCYMAHMVQDKPENYRGELMDLDRSFGKEYKQLYDIGNRSKLVRTLRTCRFRPYRFWCKYITHRFKKNGLSL